MYHVRKLEMKFGVLGTTENVLMNKQMLNEVKLTGRHLNFYPMNDYYMHHKLSKSNY